ncbi:MAG TPA: hypothetical protein VLG50_03845 [Candidatus Saccharimonadales bacterium]|nr:hypothetical protein [Candidatus Saccharimonadales bacterium]
MKGIVYILVAILCLIGFFLTKKRTTSIQQILPEKCVFLIDEGLSKSFQDTISSTITAEYGASKDPATVIARINDQYPEISSMKVHLCKTDKICFLLDGQKPLFLLNKEFVVCDNDATVPKNHFNQEIVDSLPTVTSQGEQNVSSMVRFFEKLPSDISKNFETTWLNDCEIVLQEKNKKDELFLVAVSYIPHEKDIELCRLIQDPKMSKSKKRSITYDLRFNNQIIVR